MNEKVFLKPRKDRDKSFSIRVDAELYQNYEELSRISGYSRNDLINLAMKHFLGVVDIETNDEKVLKEIQEFKAKQSKS